MTTKNTITATKANIASNDGSSMLLRDYVNLPPPPPYPGTTNSVSLASSVSQFTPNHGHSTSNISQGSNGMYRINLPKQ